MNKRKRKEKLEVGYHIVAFLDLMGQQEKLRALTKLPEKSDEAGNRELLNYLKQTYGAINGLRTNFKSYFDGLQKTSFNIKDLPIDKRWLYKNMANNPIRFHQFSDFVMAFMSLRTDHEAKLPIRGILAILGAAAITSLVSLASSQPLRGGMDIGVNLDIKHNEIYGASIARAYALESHISNYPRVVIGSELYKYIELAASEPENDEISRATVIFANECLDLLTVDYDGHIMIDFMGEYVRKRFSLIPDLDGSDIVQKAYDFVNSSSDSFKESKNTKLASKYALLKLYMRSRIHLWGDIT